MKILSACDTELNQSKMIVESDQNRILSNIKDVSWKMSHEIRYVMMFFCQLITKSMKLNEDEISLKNCWMILRLSIIIIAIRS